MSDEELEEFLREKEAIACQLCVEKACRDETIEIEHEKANMERVEKIFWTLLSYHANELVEMNEETENNYPVLERYVQGGGISWRIYTLMTRYYEDSV